MAHPCATDFATYEEYVAAKCAWHAIQGTPVSLMSRTRWIEFTRPLTAAELADMPF